MSYGRRLHHPWEYRRFFNQSEVFRLSECVIFRVPNESGTFRLGITLKARGTSIERNRVKRAIREGVRVHAEALGSFDYNVVVPASKRLAHPFHLQLAACLAKELGHALARHK